MREFVSVFDRRHLARESSTTTAIYVPGRLSNALVWEERCLSLRMSPLEYPELTLSKSKGVTLSDIQKLKINDLVVCRHALVIISTISLGKRHRSHL